MGNFSFYGNKNKEKNIIVNNYENFSDMEEIKEDIYMGTGNKKMKAYTCNLKIDELNKKREYFWSIKTNINTKIGGHGKLSIELFYLMNLDHLYY